jgi:hypothetical protein
VRTPVGAPKRVKVPRAKRDDEFDGRLREVEERQRSEEPIKWWEDQPEDIGRVMAKRNARSARRLAAAIVKALDEGSNTDERGGPKR